jgi:hypothetical protein
MWTIARSHARAEADEGETQKAVFPSIEEKTGDSKFQGIAAKAAIRANRDDN